MGTGYTRQSVADIVDGNTITAAPLNAEFNALQSAFDGTSGHSHDGTTGEGPKISLTTSISGILPVANGGFAAIHKINATGAPAVTDDTNTGYGPGSIWVDVTNDQSYICLDATASSAVWKRITLSSTSDYQPLEADLTALAALLGTGFPARTAFNTWEMRSIAGTANEITVTNPFGVAGNPTLSLPSALTFTGKTVTGGTFTGITDIAVADGGTGASTTIGAANNLEVVSYGAAQTLTVSEQAEARVNISAALMGHLFGLTLSNAADTEHDITVAVGEAASDDVSTPILMRLTSAITKRADATFAEGSTNGGMVSGESLPTSGTVHVWLIMKTDLTVDVCFNNHASSALSPTLPSGFTYKRRIGTLRTDGSANIRGFVQTDDTFLYKTPVTDVNASQGSSPTNRSLSVPLGFKLRARIAIYGTSTSQSQVAVVDPDITSKTAGSGAELTTLSNGTGAGQANVLEVVTNTSGQVSTSMNGTAANIQIQTTGWVDTRGRLA